MNHTCTRTHFFVLNCGAVKQFIWCDSRTFFVKKNVVKNITEKGVQRMRPSTRNCITRGMEMPFPTYNVPYFGGVSKITFKNLYELNTHSYGSMQYWLCSIELMCYSIRIGYFKSQNRWQTVNPVPSMPLNASSESAASENPGREISAPRVNLVLCKCDC